MRVLLIDDEETIRKGTRYLLQQLDMAVEVVGEAEDGEEGINKIKLLKPDVAFIDIRMPVMTGLELMKKVHEQQLSSISKYVMLTAYSDFEYAQTALRYGAHDYLLKPLSTVALQDLLQRLFPGKDEGPALPSDIGKLRTDAYIHEHRIKHELVIQMLHYVGANYMKDWQLTELAEFLHVNPVYASNLFKKVTSVTFISYVQQFRIQIAKELLQSQDYKIHEVAYLVGFNNVTYFGRVFKTCTGITPAEYMKKLHKRNQGSQPEG